jgi:hypothetical protein
VINGPDQLLLDGLVVAIADEGHVQLDHVGLEDGESGQAGVAGAEVVDRQPVAELPQGLDACGQVGHTLDRLALGDLEDDRTGVPREGRIGAQKRVIRELEWVDVDEGDRAAAAVQELGSLAADHAPQLVDAIQPLRGVEEDPRMGQTYLRRPNERLVAVHGATLGLENRLVDESQRAQPALEGGLEPGVVREQPVVGTQVRQDLALEPGQPVEPRCQRHGLGEGVERHRLEQVAKGALFQGLHRGFDLRVAGHEEHREIEIPRAHRPQQLQPVHPRHVDVAQDHGVLPATQQRQGPVAAACDVNLPAGLAQDRGEQIAQGHLVVDHQHAALPFFFRSSRGREIGVHTTRRRGIAGIAHQERHGHLFAPAAGAAAPAPGLL